MPTTNQQQKQRIYAAIDLKSYYASAECVARHLDPLTTNLVVADETRTEKTICLAVTPSLKSHGISGRARLFEVIQRVKQVNAERLNIAIRQNKTVLENGKHTFRGSSCNDAELKKDASLELSYIIAPPRMEYYLDLSSKIYGIYLRYISPDDIHVYSVDEVFMDITDYIRMYSLSPRALVMKLIKEVLGETGITATAGIGTNLYLCKLAMDITAKHIPPDENGVRIAELNEQSFREQLWNHTPLTDFWMTGKGTAEKLNSHYLFTMGDVARLSLCDQEWFYKTFGIDAEILIDHAWGIEPCTIKEIKSYQPGSRSLSEGQVLSTPYPFDKTRIIVAEMAQNLVYQLAEYDFTTDGIVLDLFYDTENCRNGTYSGEVQNDFYGRTAPKRAHGSRSFPPTNLGSSLLSAFDALFCDIANPALTIRRLNLCVQNVAADAGSYQPDLFCDEEKEMRREKEKVLQKTLVHLRHRYGKNVVVAAHSFEEGATGIERNKQIGGHRES